MMAHNPFGIVMGVSLVWSTLIRIRVTNIVQEGSVHIYIFISILPYTILMIKNDIIEHIKILLCMIYVRYKGGSIVVA